MKKLICFIILFFVISLNCTSFASPTEDTLKGHMIGTFTDIGTGHKLFVGTGTLEKCGNFQIEVDYYFEYDTQYSGKPTPGSIANYKFSDKSELHMQITGGSWYVDFVPDPPEVIVEMSSKIIGGLGIFKNATGKATGTGTQLYIPGTPTTFDFTVFIKNIK